MDLKFNDQDLHNIKRFSDRGEAGLRNAFFWWNKIPEGQTVPVNDVEDFAIAFMSQYNKQVGRTY